MIKRILILMVMCVCSLPLAAQNINIGGVIFASGPSVPGSCTPDGAFFFKNTTTESWFQCIAGTYQQFGPNGPLTTVTTQALLLGAFGDTALSRDSAGIVSFDTSTIGDGLGSAVMNSIQLTGSGSPCGGCAPTNSTNGQLIIANGSRGLDVVSGLNWDGTNLNVPGPVKMTANFAWSGPGLAAIAPGTGNATFGMDENNLPFWWKDTGSKVLLPTSSANIARGTKFTTNAGCTEGTLVGSASAGKFTVGQNTACTVIITMGAPASPATTGWFCGAYDQTAVPAAGIRQTASTTTTASLLMTVATNDVVSFSCTGY